MRVSTIRALRARAAHSRPALTYEHTFAVMSSMRTPSPLKSTALPLIQKLCILAARTG
jgi:hypothetical protein